MSFTGILAEVVEQLNSAVFVLLLVLGVAFYLVYKVGGLVSDWRNRESDIKALRDDWNRDIPYIRERVDILFQDFTNKSAVKSGSPLSLTAVGEEISAALDAKGVVEEHSEKLRELVFQAAPQTVYDLQRACFSVVEKHLPRMLSGEQLNIAKQQALKHGIPLDNALAVVAVALRDRLLAEKGMTLGDAD